MKPSLGQASAPFLLSNTGEYINMGAHEADINSSISRLVQIIWPAVTRFKLSLTRLHEDLNDSLCKFYDTRDVQDDCMCRETSVNWREKNILHRG